MKRKLYLVVFSILTIFYSKAQNLIPNGDFETITSCPGSLNGFGIQLATPWQTALPNSPIYFNVCAKQAKYGVPINGDSLLNYQWPHSGNGYAGFNLYSPNAFVRWYPLIELLSAEPATFVRTPS